MKTAEGEKSVPITWAYNHHYVSYITSSYSEMTKVTTDEIGILPHGGHNHGASTIWMFRVLRRKSIFSVIVWISNQIFSIHIVCDQINFWSRVASQYMHFPHQYYQLDKNMHF